MVVGILVMAGIALLTGTGGASTSMLGGLLVAMIVVTVMGTFFEEERNHGLQFLRSLPLSPAAVVTGKFVAVGAFLVLYTAATLAALGASGRPGDLPLTQVLASGATGLLLAGMAIAAFYRYGYQAIQWFFTGMFALVIAVTALLPLLAERGPSAGAWIQQALPWAFAALERFGEWTAASPLRGGLLAAALLLGVCILLGRLAARGLANRDL